MTHNDSKVIEMSNVISIKTAAQQRSRIEGYHLCESALPVFEEVFGECLLLRSAMVGALDYANGIIDEKMLAEYRRDAMRVINESAKALLRAPKGLAEPANGGIMAAYAILESLEPVVNLAEVQRKVDKAFQFSPVRRTN